MPIRIGEVFLFLFFVLVSYLGFGDRLRQKESSRAVSPVPASDLRLEDLVVSDLEKNKPEGQSSHAEHALQETGRKANVSGIWGTFECIEYRSDDLLEVHVRQINEAGGQVAPSCIHCEPFEHVIETYMGVTSW